MENETYEILRDFEIRTDHQIPARRPDLVIISNNPTSKTRRIFPFWQREIKEKNDQYLDLARELIKLGNMRVTVILVVIGTLKMVSKGLKRD